MKTVNFANKQVVPSKIVCIGRNYVEHIYELGNEIPQSMVVFNKPNSAIAKQLHYFTEDTRFEGEICFLIQNSMIAGIGFGLDLTHADIQNQMKQKGLPWERAKAFDHSAVFSDFIPLDADIKDIRFELHINGKCVQEANYDLMIYKPDVMLQEIQTFTTLEDGDIIMSGTPKGVGNYKVGDLFEGFVYEKEKLLLQTEFTVIPQTT